jgi:hypothetical protein
MGPLPSHLSVTPDQPVQSLLFDLIKQDRIRVIGELQERWQCDVHSKDKDTHCWKPAGSSVCYALTLSNLGYWAMDVVSVIFMFHVLPYSLYQIAGNSTIDVKPASLLLHEARPRSHVRPIAQDMTSQVPLPYHMNQFMMPQMVFYGGQGPTNGGYVYPMSLPTMVMTMLVV